MITNTFSFPAKYSTDSWENKSTENICKPYVSFQIFTFAKNAYKVKNLLKINNRWREWGWRGWNWPKDAGWCCWSLEALLMNNKATRPFGQEDAFEKWQPNEWFISHGNSCKHIFISTRKKNILNYFPRLKIVLPQKNKNAFQFSRTT